MTTPKNINQERLIRIFTDIKDNASTETRFCFLIGAGASKISGIKTGKELAADWYKELKKDLDEKERQQWEKDLGFDENKIAEFYSDIYEKRFEAQPELGSETLTKIMELTDPSLGYVILSQILAKEKHNFVITTNFDYLIEDAVRMYTDSKPIIAGHEKLAEFVSPQTERPTIIKVHRDLLLRPLNDNQTDDLNPGWKEALKPILKNFHLLVISYGGNDGGLMGYLKGIEGKDRKSIYWCVRKKDAKDINQNIGGLLNKKDFIVTITGFDELMHGLNSVLKYDVLDNLENPDNHPFVETTKKRVYKLSEKMNDLSKTKEEIPPETEALFTGAMAILRKAYKAAYIEKDIDKAEKYFQEAIELDPKNANTIANYALLLTNIGKDHNKAEKYYQNAIELDPKNANIIGNYALLLTNIGKDYDKADTEKLKTFAKKIIE